MVKRAFECEKNQPAPKRQCTESNSDYPYNAFDFGAIFPDQNNLANNMFAYPLDFEALLSEQNMQSDEAPNSSNQDSTLDSTHGEAFDVSQALAVSQVDPHFLDPLFDDIPFFDSIGQPCEPATPNIQIRCFRKSGRRSKYEGRSCVEFSKDHKIGKSRHFEFFGLIDAGISYVRVTVESAGNETSFTLSEGEAPLGNEILLEVLKTTQVREDAEGQPWFYDCAINLILQQRSGAEHKLTFEFLDYFQQVVVKHVVKGLFFAGHKYETGAKQSRFYAKRNNCLHWGGGTALFALIDLHSS